MKRKRFSVEQIVALLKQAQLGLPVADFSLDKALHGHLLPSSPNSGEPAAAFDLRDASRNGSIAISRRSYRKS